MIYQIQINSVYLYKKRANRLSMWFLNYAKIQKKECKKKNTNLLALF